MSDWKPQYRRWKGQSVSLWKRRFSIARYGLRLCLAGKAIRAFLFLSFSQLLFLCAVFIIFGQLVTPGSVLVEWIQSKSGERTGTIINGLSSWALLYPEIFVDGIYRIGFFFIKYASMPLTLVIVALFVHKLIAQDLASQAIVIYNSKALTRWDYLTGKFIVVATILSLIWILPIIASWIIGNALSPDWAFFYHSFPSLMRGLLVGAIAVSSLSLIALAVSSLAQKTGTAIAYWILGWVILSSLASLSQFLNPAFDYINPFAAIDTLSSAIFRMDSFISEAQSTIPFIDQAIARISDLDLDKIPATDGSIIVPSLFLATLSAISILIINRRTATS